MLAGLSELGQAYLSILNVYSLTYGLSGALLGIIVGCLPGLSATLCIALLTTLTIKMAPNDAILILICSYVGTLYGGSRTAILLNIPGTAANAASCADGHALALRGEAGRAIGIATSGAFSGTLFGVLCLAAFTPLLAEVSLSFGAYEFFWLALLGVAMSGRIVGNAGIGMGYGWWQDKHTRHHANPNHEDLDPDVAPDLLVWSQNQARSAEGLTRLIARSQAYLFFPLLTLEGFNLHVSGVRALANKAEIEKMPLDVNDVAREVIALVQPELTSHQVSLQMELARTLPMILADRIQLQQVIINLVMNGI